MKFVFLLVAAAAAGALATVALPATLVGVASNELRQLHLADLNPFRSIFNYERQRIRAGMTPEQLGIRSSANTISPVPLGPPQALKLDLGRAFEAQADSQIRQNERRMQDLQAYGRDPAHWEGAPPN